MVNGKRTVYICRTEELRAGCFSIRSDKYYPWKLKFFFILFYPNLSSENLRALLDMKRCANRKSSPLWCFSSLFCLSLQTGNIPNSAAVKWNAFIQYFVVMLKNTKWDTGKAKEEEPFLSNAPAFLSFPALACA